jgi:uncharacterized hydrophobic protein (TIGR00341 family)
MKLVEIIADSGSADTIRAIAEHHEAHDFRLGLVAEDGMQPMQLLVADDQVQKVLDAAQNVLGAQPAARTVVLPVEAVLPAPSEEERRKEDSASAVREALYSEVERNAQLNLNFIVLVILSTIVAAIGLIENNIAVLVGAMVIAPLLGPNLALGLGTALGDLQLMRKAFLTTIAGISLAIALSVLIGLAWPFQLTSHELISRTDAGLDSVALALASGAAAALSITTGLSTVLVGVMVAVALLPPAATLGLMLGHGQLSLAGGAGLLLAINLVCVNLTTKVVFLLKGIRPRTWWEKEKAHRAMTIYLAVWALTLIILLFALYVRAQNP